MSSKRKSPPTKLQEGEGGGPLPPLGGGSDGGGLTDLDETSSNNLSDGEDIGAGGGTMVNNSSAFYKLSESSSPSVSGSELDDGLDDDRTPPPTKRMYSEAPNLLMPTLSVAERRRNSSECSSPTSDIKTLHYNNNSSLHNNNSSSHPMKRSMDDVLKRLTSKINNSTIKEEKRPTPSSTPNSTNNSDVEPTAAIQQALSGDNFVEKDRKLSELILQLQMVREQLISQQQQQQQQDTKVRSLLSRCKFNSVERIKTSSKKEQTTPSQRPSDNPGKCQHDALLYDEAGIEWRPNGARISGDKPRLVSVAASEGVSQLEREIGNDKARASPPPPGYDTSTNATPAGTPGLITILLARAEGALLFRYTCQRAGYAHDIETAFQLKNLPE
ncbi:hypothetical protein TcasGA2_TC032808 [Tribolium castaneum]|nr:hypothetical protein TcasGA2_TC032808 [Tribolium castaneum]